MIRASGCEPMKQLQNNFTTPEQSKRLLELDVPADSADCYWLYTQKRTLLIAHRIALARTAVCGQIYGFREYGSRLRQIQSEPAKNIPALLVSW